MKWTSGDRGNIEDARGQLRRDGHARRRPRHRRSPAGAGPQLGDRHRLPVAARRRRRRGAAVGQRQPGRAAARRPRRRRRRPSTWSTPSWTTRRRRGSRSWAAATSRPPRCCSGTRISRAAGSRSRRPGRSTARRTTRSTWISGSSASCRAASARPATSRGPTSSRTSSAITSSRCWAPTRRCGARSRRVPTSRTRCRWRWSCRPTAMPASGATTPRSGRQPAA